MITNDHRAMVHCLTEAAETWSLVNYATHVMHLVTNNEIVLKILRSVSK